MKIYFILNLMKLVRYKNIVIFLYKLGQTYDGLTYDVSKRTPFAGQRECILLEFSKVSVMQDF
jgi:hypothetical protein